MKKLFIVCLLAVFIFTSGIALAEVDKEGPGNYIHTVTGKVKYFDSHPGLPSQWEWQSPAIAPEDQATAAGVYSARPFDFDESESWSNHGHGNDFGYAAGWSGIGGDIQTFADAEGGSNHLVYVGKYTDWRKYVDFKNWVKQYTPNEAFEQGLLYGESKTKAWSWAHDSGLTSKAGAGIKADNGFIIGEGLATGKYGDKEFVSDRLAFGADFYQNNGANEVGYLAGGVTAYNQSGLAYSAVGDWDMNEHSTIAFNTLYSSYTPDVITKGKSEVTIDPYDDIRSFSAKTENMSNIAFNGCKAPEVSIQNANVFGSGIVQGGISNGAAYVQGTSTFSYNGYTAGNGAANLTGMVTVTPGGSTSAFVSGSSRAVANTPPN